LALLCIDREWKKLVTVGPKVSDKRFKDALDLHDNYIWGLSMRLFGTGSDARGCLVAIPKVESKELELELELDTS